MGSRVEGKVALVTGAGQGIGQAIADRLAAEGAAVICADIDLAKAQSVAARIAGGALARRLDVTQEDGWIGLRDEVQRDFGRLDILVNNAGIEVSKPITEMSFQDWRGVMAVNVDGSFLGCRAMADLLTAAGAANPAGASVIHLGSVAGIVGWPNQVGYNASKAAHAHLARSLAIEWSRQGRNIRVNTIHPGPIKTEMVDQYVQTQVRLGQDEGEVWKGILQTIPLGRLGTVQSIANAALYLASDEADFVTGADLLVDGGLTAI